MSFHLINRVRQRSACEYTNLLKTNCYYIWSSSINGQRFQLSTSVLTPHNPCDKSYVPYRAKTASEAWSTAATTKLYALQVVSEEYNVSIFRMTLSGGWSPFQMFHLTVFWTWMPYPVGKSLPLIAEERVRSQFSPREVCGTGSGTGTSLSPSTSVLSCHYHSTNAPYSLSHT
jgi:hypothetical protein